MNDWMITLIIALCMYLVGTVTGVLTTHNDVEKKCLYGERLEFSGKLFSCEWLPNVTITDDVVRKPHPLSKELK